jgi:hypothetical protein
MGLPLSMTAYAQQCSQRPTTWIKWATKVHSYVSIIGDSPVGFLLIRAQIRIDERGTQHHTQFEAKPHPPLKPMAYSSGLGSMMM